MEYQEDYNIEEQEGPAKRPEMLTVLCVLSFINAVINIIVNFFYFVFYDVFQEILSMMASGEGIYEDMAEEMGDSWSMVTESVSALSSIGRGYYFTEMVLFIASFVGVLMMWKLQKKGFHVYAISQIIMLIVVALFAKITFGPVFWTALFVIMYFSHYKKVMQ